MHKFFQYLRSIFRPLNELNHLKQKRTNYQGLTSQMQTQIPSITIQFLFLCFPPCPSPFVFITDKVSLKTL